MINFKSGSATIIGKPNVGKSTLSNELFGKKIVATSHKTQTTRHKINLIIKTNKYQIMLIDSPGLHLNQNKLINQHMNKIALTSLNEVDIIIWVVEANTWQKEDEYILKILVNVSKKIILIINKIDKVDDKIKIIEFLKFLQQKHRLAELIPISCFSSKDIAKVKQVIINNLPNNKPFLATTKHITSANSSNFIISEFIREKLMRNLDHEVPYDTTVVIEHNYQKRKIRHIYATIIVAKKSQKNIIIGKNGLMLKTIGVDSRKTIEKLLKQKVFLKLWIKVQKNWNNNESDLIKFGYTYNG